MKTDYNRLQAQIWGLPRSPLRLELVEQAVAMADTMNDISAGYMMRQELMSEACFGGHPDKLLVAFSWCLAQADKDPQEFPEANLLWKYKWAIANLRDYPQISRGQMESSVADFSARVARNGASKRTVHHKACEMAYELGDRAKVQELLPLWKKGKRDWLSDCLACELDSLVSMSLFLGDEKQALAQVADILKKGLSCSTVPYKSYRKALIPLVRAGEYELAAEYHRRGYLKIKYDLGYLESISGHLIYLVLISDQTKALTLFQRHIELAMQSPSPLDRLFFYRASLFLFNHLAKMQRPERKMQLAQNFPLYEESGRYDTRQLAAWFNTESRHLAAQFDARAGNSYRMESIDELTGLEELIRKPPGKVY